MEQTSTQQQDPGPAVAFRRGGEVWVAILLEREHWWQFWRPRLVEKRLSMGETIRFYQTIRKAATAVGLQIEEDAP